MSGHSAKIGLVSLGCPKALVDSERIVTRLRADGYQISPHYDDADLVIVNTCGFIEPAVAESLEAIAEALDENGRVIVTGCLGAKEDIDLRERFPAVLAVTGPNQEDELLAQVRRAVPPPEAAFAELIPGGELKLTPPHYAYLKISEGCNHRCTFCIIPRLRGSLVSRPLSEVADEAQRLVNRGVKELLVISQDTGAYGVDLRYRQDTWRQRTVQTRLLDLAQILGDLGIWIRLHYVYPYPHIDALIPLMAEGRLLPYLDIPFQHASAAVLKAMRRPAHAENILRRLDRWRTLCPELAVRSTFIVGFPGETEEDFATLLRFLEEAQLDRVGCFRYSPVAGAAANALPDAVPESLKQERQAELMALQARISAARLRRWHGRTMTVLVDEVGADQAVGRSFRDAPEIDGRVYIDTTARDVDPGDWVSVVIDDSDEHDLFGHPAPPAG